MKIFSNKFQSYIASANGGRLLLFAAIATFLTILAPLGSDEITPIWARALYWYGLIFFGAGVSIVLSGIWIRLFDVDESALLSFPTISLILAISSPITLVVYFLGWGAGFNDPGIALPVLFFYVVTITVAVTVTARLLDTSHHLRRALEEAESKATHIHTSHHNKEGTVPPTGFAPRLTQNLRDAELISLSSEDHYLRVVTNQGDDHIRCTMAEAADELAGINGRVIHRSHWVAHDAVEGLEG